MSEIETRPTTQGSAKSSTTSHINILDWGEIEYDLALQRQQDLVDLVQRELARETLIFCSHPPVVTLGRGTLPGDVFGWSGPTLEVNRGGRATYHGPSQIVVYPIFDLNHRGRDLHKHMRLLEEATVATLASFGIQASGRTSQLDAEGANQEATGVWVGSRKIASIGLGVRRWVSFHGLAINVGKDPLAFEGMKPCGFAPGKMISMEEVLGAEVLRAHVQKRLQEELLKSFNR